MRLFFTQLLLLISVSCFARKEGQAFIDSMFDKLATARHDTERIKYINNISSEYSLINAEEGIKYGNRALQLSIANNFRLGIAVAHQNLGMNYETQGDLAAALEHCIKALNIYEELGRLREMTYMYSNIAVIYQDEGNMEKAKEKLLLALKIKEELKDDLGIAIDLGALAQIYALEHDTATALRHLFRAKKIVEGLGLHYEIANVYSSIATTYGQNQDLLHSLEYHLRAKEEFEKAGNDHGLMLCIGNIGGVYLAFAENYPSGAIDKGYELEMKQSLIPVGKLANAQKAIQYLDQAMQMGRQQKALDDIVVYAEALSNAYLVTGNPTRALEAYKQFTLIKDSLSALQNKDRLAVLETKFETREKDKQIADQKKKLEYNRNISLLLGISTLLVVAIGFVIYRSQRRTAALNRQVTIQKKELEQLNGVKDRIFSVISHDLRTPVNSLITFTDLLEHGELPQEKLKAYTGILKSSLGHTEELMQNLLSWARTQMQGYKPVLEKFDASDTAHKVVALMTAEAGRKGLQIQNNITAGNIVYADMNITELLLRNLLSNAIKFTPAGGIITLSAQRPGSQLRLQVKDTGIGISQPMVASFNAGLAQAIGSTAGTDNEKGTGMGLMLCKNFATLMNGSVILESEVGVGSCFTLEMPGAN